MDEEVARGTSNICGSNQDRKRSETYHLFNIQVSMNEKRPSNEGLQQYIKKGNQSKLGRLRGSANNQLIVVSTVRCSQGYSCAGLSAITNPVQGQRTNRSYLSSDDVKRSLTEA